MNETVTKRFLLYFRLMMVVWILIANAFFHAIEFEYSWLIFLSNIMLFTMEGDIKDRFISVELGGLVGMVLTVLAMLAIAAGTQFTRWLPFWLFPEKKDPPAVVLYLGKVLPPAMMGLLTVYCFKNVTWLSGAHGAPELLASAAVVGLHLWKRNVLFSIAGGTALYMVLVQAVFA